MMVMCAEADAREILISEHKSKIFGSIEASYGYSVNTDLLFSFLPRSVIDCSTISTLTLSIVIR
jgi:hypothetical protein